MKNVERVYWDSDDKYVGNYIFYLTLPETADSYGHIWLDPEHTNPATTSQVKHAYEVGCVTRMPNSGMSGFTKVEARYNNPNGLIVGTTDDLGDIAAFMFAAGEGTLLFVSVPDPVEEDDAEDEEP